MNSVWRDVRYGARMLIRKPGFTIVGICTTAQLKALGARTRDVLLMVLRQGMSLVVIGVVLGVAGAYAVTRTIRSLLFAVGTTDPLTFVLVSLLLAAVGFLACYLPARRATKVDPLIALRYE